VSSKQVEGPFDSIESAHDFMDVLASTILEAINDLKHDQERELPGSRRAQAVELAMFKLKTLSLHVHKSRRELNDLRTIRRLLFEEREAAQTVRAATAAR
jgi:hypothetical protein